MMAIRAMWKGVIQFGDIRVPVKLYAALEDRHVHFRLLHRSDLKPVHQFMVNPDTEEIVSPKEIRRAYITESGDRVLLNPSDLAALEPAPSRDIEIIGFLPLHAIDHRWYDRPYYLGPDVDGDEFYALADTLEKMQVEGVARWVMRNKSYVGALQLYQGYPMLISLHHTEEIVPIESLDPPKGPPLDQRELSLAQQLMAMLESEFHPQEYHDEFRDRVQALMTAKAKGKPLRIRAPRRKQPLTDIRSALETSIQQMSMHEAHYDHH